LKYNYETSNQCGAPAVFEVFEELKGKGTKNWPSPTFVLQSTQTNTNPRHLRTKKNSQQVLVGEYSFSSH
jgi:hypothetical protein